LELNAAQTVKVERSTAGELVVRVRDLKTRGEQTIALNEAARLLPGTH
jgi:hypothetical protein